MSLQTWLEEFMPVPADKCEAGYEADHAVRKWRGLTKENLEQHGMKKEKSLSFIGDKDKTKAIGSDTCALCILVEDKSGHIDCTKCTGRKANDNSCYDAYLNWRDTGDPTDMIRWCEVAAAYQRGLREAAKDVDGPEDTPDFWKTEINKQRAELEQVKVRLGVLEDWREDIRKAMEGKA